MKLSLRASPKHTSLAAAILVLASCYAEARPLMEGAVEGIEGHCTASPVTRMQNTRVETVSCLEYDYDGATILVMRHTNTALNCCPGVIAADVLVKDSVITITQREEFFENSACRCLCTYDLRYRLHDIGPAQYHLNLVEPYVQGTNKPLAFDMPLTKASTGKRCVPRRGYPWSP